MSLSNQVKIILIETTSSGNIGSTLRAMKNMGFSNLCLINPKKINFEESISKSKKITEKKTIVICN